MRAAFLCLAALAQLALNAAAEPRTIPLYERSSNDGIFKAGGKALENGVLAGKVELGNPPQEFTFAFDTTTGFSWVRGKRCKTDNCLDRCSYSSIKSKTAHSTGKKFSVEYGDSCVDTHLYTDTIRFAGLKVDDFAFGGAYRMSGFADGFDGYLGLGRSVDFNETKVHSAAAAGMAKRDVPLPDSAFVPAAFQSGSGIASAQFGIYTTGSGGAFDQSGSVNGGDAGNAGTTTPNTGSTNPLTPGQTTAPAPVASGTPNTGAPNAGTPNAGTPSAGTPNAGTPNAGTPNAGTPNAGTGNTGNVTPGGFGVFKRSNDKEEKPAGYLVLGGVDLSAIEGKFNYIRLADDPGAKAKNWDICIRHASFGSNLRFKQEPNAIASISTSTSNIIMPPQQADAFHKEFNAKYQSATKNYAIKCSEAKNIPLLKMTLEDHIVELPAKYWIYVVDADSDSCATKITRGNNDRDWVLGTSMTNAFYTTFDPETETVGLAIKKGHKKDGLRVYKKSH